MELRKTFSRNARQTCMVLGVMTSLVGCKTINPWAGPEEPIPMLGGTEPQRVPQNFTFPQSVVIKGADPDGEPIVAARTGGMPPRARPAIPVVGQPDLVKSPYMPAAGLIDVAGFRPGTVLKDPYSGQFFSVPQPVKEEE